MSEKLQELLTSLTPEQAAAVMSNAKTWAETFLINPEDGKPFRCNAVQERILTSSETKIVVRVHRRAGKSYSFAVKILFHALTQSRCKILVVGPMNIHVKEIFSNVHAFIRANDWIKPYITKAHENPFRIEFSNGSQATGVTTGTKSKSGGLSARGQTADVILVDEAAYLNEEDWESLKAVMKGDGYRAGRVVTICASTPAFNRGAYYKMCTELSQSRTDGKRPIWYEIHQDVLSNSSLTEEYKQACREECTSDLEWTKEWMACFPELGEGVFPKKYVDLAQHDFDYGENLKLALAEDREKRPPSRTIGVDWDKYNRDGCGPNIAVLEFIGSSQYRVIYKQEIAQSEFSFTNAVNRVCELNEIFRPEFIFVDAGSGEYQLEEFKTRGLANPETGLHKKVFRISFKSVIETPMPGGGPPDRKTFKHAMVNVLRMWFEREQLQMSKWDKQLYDQFIGYHIKSQSANTLVYSSENEHGIDAVGLAAMAMHHKVKNPYGFKPATRSHVVPVPQPVPGQLAKQLLKDQGGRGLGPARAFRGMQEDLWGSGTFARSSLGDAGPMSRRGF